MADAFSANFLTHARGGAMNWKRVQAFGELFRQLGDCGSPAPAITAPEPAIRPLAYVLVDAAQPQASVVPTSSFHNRFAAQCPQLIAPDATT